MNFQEPRRTSRETKRDSQEDKTIDQQMVRDSITISKEQKEVSPGNAQEPKEDMLNMKEDGQEK